MKLTAAALAVMAYGVVAAAADEGVESRNRFVTTYCVSCHSGAKPKGDLRIESLGYELEVSATRDKWKRVLQLVADGEMPPPTAKVQPSDAAREQFANVLKRDLVAAYDRAQPGGTLIRRLNRIEYLNTLRDLFQIREVRLPPAFPEDVTDLAFDTMPAGMYLSPAHLDVYLQVATEMADRMVLLPSTSQIRSESTFENMGRDEGRSSWVKNQPGNPAYSFTGLNIAGWSGALWDATFIAHASGVYRVRLNVCAEADAGVDGKPLRLGFYALNPVDYDLPKRANRSDLPRVGSVEVTNREPGVVECDLSLEQGETFHVYCENRLPDDYPARGANRRELSLLVKGAKSRKEPTIRLEHMVVTGPVARLDRQTRFLQNQRPIRDAAYIISVLFPLAERAFRRRLTEAEQEELVTSVLAHIDAAPEPDYGIHYGIRRILCSPQFLYRDAAEGRLDDFALASRMSYFLWSSMPDDELLKFAREGRLSEPEVLRPQVLRMIRHASAQRFVKHFTGQWLANREAAAVMVCDIRHVWSELIRYGYVHSTELFFDEILQRNLSIRTFIDSDFTYANEPMRIAWKMPDQRYTLDDLERDQRQSLEWPEPERLDLTTLAADVPAEVANRGGVLGLSSVLIATGDGVESSPILRGVWILKNLFGTPPPPPPSDVPALVADTSGARTVRETLAAHQKVESCARCHAKIDPLGLAMENYDASGAWRTAYQRSYLEESTKLQDAPATENRVDSSAVFPDGAVLNGPRDIKQYLIARPQLFTACLTTKLLEYGTGRAMSVGDERIVKEIVDAEPPEGYGFQDLLVRVIQSDAFQSK